MANEAGYDISPDKDQAGINLYGIGKGLAQVNNPQIWLEQQKMAMEADKAQREEQAKMEGARQAKLEGDLGKLKDHTREADNPYFAKKISDFNQLVQDNIGDYYDKDIRKSTAAAMKIKEAANGLNSDIDYSNNLGKQEVMTDNLVDHNKTNYWNNDLTNWEANKKKMAFGDDKASISNAPEQRINLAKKWKEEVMPRLAQTGDVTPIPVNLGNGVIDIQYKINNADAVDKEKNAFIADQTVDNYLTKHLDNSSKDTQDFFKNPNTGEYNKRALLDALIPTETPRQKDVTKTIPENSTGGTNNPDKQVYVSEKVTPEGDHELTSGKPLEKKVNGIELSGTVKGDKGAPYTNQSAQPTSLKFVTGKNGTFAEVGVAPVGLETEEGKKLIADNIKKSEDLDDLNSRISKIDPKNTALLATLNKQRSDLQGAINAENNKIADASKPKIVVVPKMITNDEGKQVSNPSYRSAEALWKDNHANKSPQDFFNEKNDKAKYGVINFSRDKSDAPKAGATNTAPQTITLDGARKANPNFKGTDAELINRYKTHNIIVK